MLTGIPRSSSCSASSASCARSSSLSVPFLSTLLLQPFLPLNSLNIFLYHIALQLTLSLPKTTPILHSFDNIAIINSTAQIAEYLDIFNIDNTSLRMTRKTLQISCNRFYHQITAPRTYQLEHKPYPPKQK